MADNEVMSLNFAAAPERYPWHGALWSALAQSLDQLPHALLLQGRPGLGKHAFAVQLAQALLCERPRAAVACGACHNCRMFQAGTHPDFHVLQPEEISQSEETLCSMYAERYPIEKKREKPSADITIYQIRSLIEDMQIRPYSATRRVVLISPAEAMNINAANGLLKLLEEPPLGSQLLLVTSHPARLPATIRSRCARLLFRLPAPAVGRDWLQARPGMIGEAALLLELAGGAPLQAEVLAHEDFPALRAKLLQDMTALAQGREHPVNCASRWKGQGTALVLGWLHGYVSDLIKRQLGAPDFTLRNPELRAQSTQNKNKYQISELYAFIDAILENYRLLGGPLDELLLLEDILIRWVRLSRLQ